MSDKYKIKIDKDLLTELLVKGPTEHNIKELYKVMNVVFIKHYSKYYMWAEELKQDALLAVLERRERYDPSYSAHNYIYTIVRNEVGNRITKLTREQGTGTEVIIPTYTIPSDTAVPPEIKKYVKYLTGEQPFTYIRIARREVTDLILFIRIYESKRSVTLPSFIESNTNLTQTMYKLLKEIIENE